MRWASFGLDAGRPAKAFGRFCQCREGDFLRRHDDKIDSLASLDPDAGDARSAS